VKTRLEALADRLSDLAGHRYTWPAVGVLWLLTRDPTFSDGIQLFLMFVLLNVQSRETAAVNLKLDALVKYMPEAPSGAAGHDRDGKDDLERMRRDL
jgi:low affinity Fe/Cu permease